MIALVKASSNSFVLSIPPCGLKPNLPANVFEKFSGFLEEFWIENSYTPKGLFLYPRLVFRSRVIMGYLTCLKAVKGGCLILSV